MPLYSKEGLIVPQNIHVFKVLGAFGTNVLEFLVPPGVEVFRAGVPSLFQGPPATSD